MEPTTSYNEKEARQGIPYVMLLLNSFQYQFSHYIICKHFGLVKG
jgi:hypothetical protein